jgi:quinoprotein glucose dehydrogenase
MGLTFVLDRDTGKPLFPVQELPVPPSTVPGEEAWPTQPFPLKPPPLVRLSLDEADLTAVTPESHNAALEQFRKYETGFIYTPPSLRGIVTTPSHQGGVEWGGASFDPHSNVLYVNANEAPTINTLRLFYDTDKAGTPAEQGASLYKKNCTSCHGLERRNLPTYPALKDIKRQMNKSNNVTAGFGHHAWVPTVFRQEIDALVAFLRSDLVTPQQIKRSAHARYN